MVQTIMPWNWNKLLQLKVRRRGINFFSLDLLWACPQIINGRSLRKIYDVPWSLHANLFMGASAPLPWTSGGPTVTMVLSECLLDRWFYPSETMVLSECMLDRWLEHWNKKTKNKNQQTRTKLKGRALHWPNFRYGCLFDSLESFFIQS